MPPTGEQTAPFGEGDLAIRRHGEAWRATHTVGKAEIVLADGFYPACYRACPWAARLGYLAGAAVPVGAAPGGQGGGEVIALAIAMVGLMAARCAVGVGVYRALRG